MEKNERLRQGLLYGEEYRPLFELRALQNVYFA